MSSIAERLTAGRQNASAKGAKIRSSQRQNLLANVAKGLQSENNRLKEEIEYLRSELIKEQEHQVPNANSIINELSAHMENDEIPYSDEIMKLSIDIQNVSPQAYRILADTLPFPRENAIEKKISDLISGFPEKLIDKNMINDVVNSYKIRNGIPLSRTIDACLAVDAIYFTPDVSITKDSEVEGIDFGESKGAAVPKNAYKIFTKSPEAFDSFVKLNYDKIVKAGFVFQIQPYDITIQPFVVHILPATNGKANENVVNLLHEIRDTVKKRNINIRSYAFDGDNAYKNLHKMYYETYIHKTLNTHTLGHKNKNQIQVVSDFLHLIKRLRYRLLSLLIHAGFDLDSITLEIEKIKETLKSEYPVIWDNNIYTKMHDKLPIELFKVENLVKLIEAKNFPAACYWFPISLALIAIDGDSIGDEYRKFFLETAFWFLVFYREAWTNSEGTLKQRAYQKDHNVTFYTEDLLIEFTNTIHCHLRLMESLSSFSFDRNSSMPLEHKFGIARMRARNVHTLRRFLRTISTLQADLSETSIKQAAEFNLECEKIPIKKRRSTFGVSVTSESKDQKRYCVFYDEREHQYTPQQVARSFLIISGFQLSYNEEVIDIDAIISWLYCLLVEFCDDKQVKRKAANCLSLINKRLGVGQGSNGKRLIIGTPEKTLTSKDDKYEFTHNLLVEICGREPTKEDLNMIISTIKQSDPTAHTPKKTEKKYKLQQWI